MGRLEVGITPHSSDPERTRKFGYSATIAQFALLNHHQLCRRLHTSFFSREVTFPRARKKRSHSYARVSPGPIKRRLTWAASKAKAGELHSKPGLHIDDNSRTMCLATVVLELSHTFPCFHLALTPHSPSRPLKPMPPMEPSGSGT